MKKIVNITFWVSFLSVLLHYFVYYLIKDSGDIEFIKRVTNLMFISGGVVILSYWLTPVEKAETED